MRIPRIVILEYPVNLLRISNRTFCQVTGQSWQKRKARMQKCCCALFLLIFARLAFQRERRELRPILSCIILLMIDDTDM